MRLLSFFALTLLLSAGSSSLSFGQAPKDMKYYEAVSADGSELPKPDPWCKLAHFGSRSLWECPRSVDLGLPNLNSSHGKGEGGAGGGFSGGGSSSGGMNGGGSTGGMGVTP